MTKQPNIIYINSHDTGRYVQPYGFAVPTPNIQNLAERGVLFRQAFCAAPTCSASRAALLLGTYPHCTGMLGLAHRGFKLTEPEQHLARTLRDAGYFTALSGTQHVAGGDYVLRLGYESILTGDGGKAHTTAVDFLNGAPKEPFYLEVGFGETHRMFPKADSDMQPSYFRPPEVLPDTPETREDMAEFATLARILDRKMGAVFDAVEKSGLADRTLIICTTDHGVSFPFMKCNLTDHGIGVMLIIAGPKPFAGGQALHAMVSHIDIFPTLCDWLGIDKPDWVRGVSMMPVLYGEQEEIRNELFAEVTYHAAYEPMRCVRTRRWKYTKRYDGRTRPVLPNCDDCLSKDVLLKHGWRDKAIEEEQLFDLVFDPAERCNVAGRPDLKPVLDDMRSRLARYMAETDDPLLKGPVPPPKGAKYNDPDGLSPREEPMTAE